MCYLKAHEIQRKAFGDSQQDLGATACSLARIYFAQGEHAKALENYQRALKIACAALGEDHQQVRQEKNSVQNL